MLQIQGNVLIYHTSVVWVKMKNGVPKNDRQVSSSRIMNYCDGPFSFQMKLSSLSPSEGVPDPEVPWDCTANTGIPADFPRPKHVKRTTEQSQLTKEKLKEQIFLSPNFSQFRLQSIAMQKPT